MERVLAEELRQMIARAMAGVKPRHRAVLSMRCYDGMSFAEIGAAMGCSEFGAQMLFYRAKKSLARQLGRHGLGKGSLLMARVVFGKMTAADEAAAARISVSAATLQVGGAAVAAAMAASRGVLVTAAAASAVTVGVIAVNSGDGAGKMQPNGEIGAVSAALLPDSGERGADECWYFYPQGAGGPVTMRQVRHDRDGEAECRILQNEYANYEYRGGVVEIRNARAYAADLSVWRLPTDGEDLTAFLDHMEGLRSGGRTLEYINTRRQGLLVIADRQGGVMTGISRVDRHENMLAEEYFQFAWPADCRVMDRRDAMHARGWTYFEVEGRLGTQAVSGRGCMPFVYSACEVARPWVELCVGSVRYVDSRGVATATGAEEVRCYRGGTFMAGLARPWMGLHTIDTVRRDAAATGTAFVTRRGPERGKAQVELTAAGRHAVYTIDLERDVIEVIEFTGDVEGRLAFRYLQEVEGAAGRLRALCGQRDDGRDEGLGCNCAGKDSVRR